MVVRKMMMLHLKRLAGYSQRAYLQSLADFSGCVRQCALDDPHRHQTCSNGSKQTYMHTHICERPLGEDVAVVAAGRETCAAVRATFRQGRSHR